MTVNGETEVDNMAILDIVTIGAANDVVLRRQADRVREFGPELHALLDDMLETMRDAPGVGLAAPQIGVSSASQWSNIRTMKTIRRTPCVSTS